jgi:hypothetical protein
MRILVDPLSDHQRIELTVGKTEDGKIVFPNDAIPRYLCPELRACEKISESRFFTPLIRGNPTPARGKRPTPVLYFFFREKT